MFVKWFNHKNNHVHKHREYNRLKLLAMSLNNMLRHMYLFIKTNIIGRKKGTTSTFNWPIFDTPTVIPTIEVECIIEWTKHQACSTCWRGNLCRIEMVVYETQLLYSIAIISFRSTLVICYYTSKSVHVLNPITTNSKLKHNQLLT